MSWRPFEPSSEEIDRIKKERDSGSRKIAELMGNRCNLHDDCAAADARVAAAGGRISRDGSRMMSAVHCSIDDCEDCFGC